MLRLITALHFICIASESLTGCHDKNTSCNKHMCAKFPEFARNSCGKTCGFCDPAGSGLSGSSSLQRSGARSGACYDKDPDCSREVCRDYPYTAKERCAKFCGLCHDSSSSVSGSHFSSGSSSTLHQQSTTSRSSISGSLTSITKERESSICIDKDLDCSLETCRNYPYTAKERCARTCGLCRTGSGIGSGLRTSVGSYEPAGTTSLRRGNEAVTANLCFDKDTNCQKDTCRNYPFTAKERCAKTCGLCRSDTTDYSSSSAIASGSVSPSRHASIRINEPIGGNGRLPTSRSYGEFDNTPAYSTLSKDRELECIDLDRDCNQRTCNDYPHTAKERCAKTCGFCRKEMTAYGTRHSSIADTATGSSSRRGSESSMTAKECRDENPNCSEQSCLDRPNTARTKCAKTCGFCSQGGSTGSAIDLKTPSVDSDDGITITLDNDDDTKRRPPPAMSGHSDDAAVSTHDSRRPSTGSRSDLVRKPSIRTQQFTTQAPIGTKIRYPGRTGPCADANEYCEKADCYKYPRFAQRYCEKTCDFC